MPDILDRILEQRERDLRALGPAFGVPVPPRRFRPPQPFLKERGAILEVKRASPSRGPIAPDLDVTSLCNRYAEAGARAVSVLTEGRFFLGSLADLAEAAQTLRSQPIALLRKDFLQELEEIEVSYRFGSDAVLLIARILEQDRLTAMAKGAYELGMTPFVEVRTEEDVAKLLATSAEVPVIAGVNARDLATFTIDPLVPAALVGRLPVPVVYESGIQNPAMAAFARQLGFRGILVGEEAARRPEDIGNLVSAFMKGSDFDVQQETDIPADIAVGRFWRRFAERRQTSQRPLVKICGLTNCEDAALAARLGADLLGFVFAPSPRAAKPELPEMVREALDHIPATQRPLLIGVITETESPLARSAIALCREGSIDALQLHGEGPFDPPVYDLPHYRALRIGSDADLEAYCRLRQEGQVRVLLDSRVDSRLRSDPQTDLLVETAQQNVDSAQRFLDVKGGTGKLIGTDLLDLLVERGRPEYTSMLWLAGGLGPDTVGPLLQRYRIELVDASSRLEECPGKKSPELLRQFFEAIAQAVAQGELHKN
ncbi:MAG: bifunctional indole-3-glycerol phosphate synthase/phosphoribosylanthranilate isomerase [Termitinemataceae bacterium]